MNKTLRHGLAVAPLVAAVALAMTAAPAAAQSSGKNGTVWYSVDDGPDPTPCPYISSDADSFMAFSKDNKQLAITDSFYNPTHARVVPRAEVTGPESLAVIILGTCSTTQLGDVDFGSTFSFSPDGKQLAVQSNGDVNVISASTGRVVRNLTPGTSATVEGDPAWSPDGKLIAYSSPDGVRRLPATGGSSTLVARSATHPDFSPDGKNIAYINGAEKIAYSSVSTNKLVKTTAIVTDGHRLFWSPDGTQFLFEAPPVDPTPGDDFAYCATGTTGSKITHRYTGQPDCVPQAWQRR